MLNAITEGPVQDEVVVGAEYIPTLLDDHSGAPVFRQATAKLVQFDIRDTENELIPAWETRKRLVPGTLVLCNVSMHCYNLMFNKRGRRVSGFSARKLALTRFVGLSAKPQQPAHPTRLTVYMGRVAEPHSPHWTTRFSFIGLDDGGRQLDRDALCFRQLCCIAIQES